jgi:hypothetical protein
MTRIEIRSIEPEPMMRKQEITQTALSMTNINAQGWVRFLRLNKMLTRARSLIENIKIPPTPKSINNDRLKRLYLL